MKLKDGASPFDCNDCSKKQQRNRNCKNQLGLEDTGIVWGEYKKAEQDRINKRLSKAGAKKVYNLGDIRLYECPNLWITPETNSILRMVYLARETGVLYAAGGWADQPKWFTEAYKIVRRETLLWEAKKR